MPEPTRTVEERLARVLAFTEEVPAEILRTPKMYGSPLAVELQFLQCLEVRLIAEGFDETTSMRMLREIYYEHVNRSCPKTPRILTLSGRFEWKDADVEKDWESFVGVLRSFLFEGFKRVRLRLERS